MESHLLSKFTSTSVSFECMAHLTNMGLFDFFLTLSNINITPCLLIIGLN